MGGGGEGGGHFQSHQTRTVGTAPNWLIVYLDDINGGK